jgi:hypothetical protein
LFRRLLKAESGYSLIEVLASIMILTIAILPMVGVFDSGLKSVTVSSNYDKARALANLKMEQAKSLPFDSGDATIQDVEHDFPLAAGAPGTPTAYNSSGTYPINPPINQSDWRDVEPIVGATLDADYSNFHYWVEKQYLKQPSLTPGSSEESFVECNAIPNTCDGGTDLIRVTVTVGWGAFSSGAYSKTYTTFGGLVAS